MSPDSDDMEPTRRSLLARLKNWEDQQSWFDFFTKYWRLIYSVARRSGLSDDEAQEVVQETMVTVCKNIGRFSYDPKRCLFRSWLLMVTRHRIINLLRKQTCRRDRVRLSEEGMAGMAEAEVLKEPDLERIWDEEWQRNLITAASEQVKRQIRAKQFQIYDLYALQGWPAKRVAGTMKVSRAQVYLAKHRVGRLMRKAVLAIEQQ